MTVTYEVLYKDVKVVYKAIYEYGMMSSPCRLVHHPASTTSTSVPISITTLLLYLVSTSVLLVKFVSNVEGIIIIRLNFRICTVHYADMFIYYHCPLVWTIPNYCEL